ncbi:MAG TPA: 2'-5' RNA ligase family protein [Gemmatimonadaceae bacterium]|nr:2'-5' RNA ligase family protein [Gemmatimonadaceae bacterium]
MKSGIFIVAELTGAVRERVLEIQRWADPKLAGGTPPHITLVGSSGVGPMPIGTPVEALNEHLEAIGRTTAPIPVRFGAPHRFMQTDIIVLPIDPHGPLRTLHERIATSGLLFERPRFSFSPHVTLSFYQTLTPERERRLLALRVNDPVLVDRIQCYLTLEPQPARRVLEVPLTGPIREEA